MFNEPNEGCMSSLMGAMGAVNFCEPIQILFDEHKPLRKQMEEILTKAEKVAGVEQGQRNTEIAELTRLVEVYKVDLIRHSAKEEEGLFPILGRHIGTQFGPIAIMEHEHSEGKRYINEYLTKQKELPSPITPDSISDLSLSIIRGIQVLMDHFSKEENVLFPMAERTLTQEEKDELLAIVKA